jgi:hypothetical protein
MVAQRFLEPFVVVRIHLRQPNLRSKFGIEAALSSPTKRRAVAAEIPK